jgi:hypothetical protein
MTNAIQQPTPGEHVREHYRKQGRQQERERICDIIWNAALVNHFDEGVSERDLNAMKWALVQFKLAVTRGLRGEDVSGMFDAETVEKLAGGNK